MKLTAKVKLQPNKEQYQTLLETLKRANTACNYVSDVAWQEQVFTAFSLHKTLYYAVKERFGFTAQIVVRVLGKVADAYKLDKKTQRFFKPHGAFPYDDRILRWYANEVSIWTLSGRQRIPFVAGERQLELLQNQRGESELAFVDGSFYLFATCEVTEPDPRDVSEYLGIDLGIVNIAVDSMGTTYTGNKLNALRKRQAKLRAKLQSKNTKSAKRLLKKRRRKEMRMANDINHSISKKIVEMAQRHFQGIALENLTGIRERITVRKSQRRQHSSWAFADLRAKIDYKAALNGIPILFVDPRNTSRTCPICGCIDKRNRQSQNSFLCIGCGYSAPADFNAACNIARRAAVVQPNAVGYGLTASPRL